MFAFSRKTDCLKYPPLSATFGPRRQSSSVTGPSAPSVHARRDDRLGAVDPAPRHERHTIVGDAVDIDVVADVQAEGIWDADALLDQLDDLLVASGLQIHRGPSWERIGSHVCYARDIHTTCANAGNLARFAQHGRAVKQPCVRRSTAIRHPSVNSSLLYCGSCVCGDFEP